MPRACSTIALAILTLSLSACAKIPSQAIQVNGILNKNIADAETKSVVLINAFFRARQDALDDWFLHTYEPKYLINYTAAWNAVHPTDPFDLTKPAQRSDYVQNVIASYSGLVAKVDVQREEFIAQVHKAYGSMLMQNEAIGSLLKSAKAVNDADVKAWNETAGRLVPGISTGAIDGAIDKIKADLMKAGI